MAVATPPSTLLSPRTTKKLQPQQTSGYPVRSPHSNTPLAKVRVDRTSFSSTKESISGGVAQSFTESKISSYGGQGSEDEEAIDDSGSDDMMSVQTAGVPLNPSGYLCPCDGVRGWKQIAVRGKLASKSFGDLMRAKSGWTWNGEGDVVEIVKKQGIRKKGNRYAAGQSPLELLPAELLGAVTEQLLLDIPPEYPEPRNTDLVALLLTSRSIHSATLSTLYSNITIPHSRIFRKLLSHISVHPALGTCVRRLDFSHFNRTRMISARERAQTMNLIPETLLQCLNLLPKLQEFLAQEHIEDELSYDVLSTLFRKLTNLKALDFCACSSTTFRDALQKVTQEPLPETLPMKRLSFHECSTLPSSILSSIIPSLSRLSHLDMAHTRITDNILFSIPATARLTHLNLSKCSHLSGPAVVEFIAKHPAARSLIYLNLAMDAKSHEMLSSSDLLNLLRILPSTLRSLNLKGSKMDSSHIPLLLPLTKHTEELGLGLDLTLLDITALFFPRESEHPEDWHPHSLRYIDVSDLSDKSLDLSHLFSSSFPLLGPSSLPFEVMEVSQAVFKMMKRSPGQLKRVGWCVKDVGRRYWLVRDVFPASGKQRDLGGREWKWGATYWGMRKVPVARQEVGGMYGHYMFKC